MQFILCVSVMDEVYEVSATHWMAIDGLWSRMDPDLILISPAGILLESQRQQF